MTLPEMLVTSREDAGRILKRKTYRNSLRYICSLGEVQSHLPEGFRKHPAHKLRLEFDDVERAHALWYEGATHNQVEQLLAWADLWVQDPGPILIHCAAGVSRSTACALVAIAHRLGPGEEDASIRHLLHAIDHTQKLGYRHGQGVLPNRRVVALADVLMEREGKLLEAVQKAFKYNPVEFTL
jgi:predicted protein tyrosine phosphatase